MRSRFRSAACWGSGGLYWWWWWWWSFIAVKCSNSQILKFNLEKDKDLPALCSHIYSPRPERRFAAGTRLLVPVVVHRDLFVFAKVDNCGVIRDPVSLLSLSAGRQSFWEWPIPSSLKPCSTGRTSSASETWSKQVDDTATSQQVFKCDVCLELIRRQMSQPRSARKSAVCHACPHYFWPGSVSNFPTSNCISMYKGFYCSCWSFSVYTLLAFCLMFPLSVCLSLSGEMAKQMKVKKLKNLKTLDSKPGKCFILFIFCVQLSHKLPFIFMRKQILTVQSLSD